MNIIGMHGALDWEPHDLRSLNVVHDSGCTLFVDGKHIRSIDEERLSRIKYDGRFPHKSIDYCLGDIKKEDIDIVCFSPSGVRKCSEQMVEKVASKIFRNIFPNAKLWYVSHHLAHAASAIFTAPFNSGSFLTIDGMGSALWDFSLGYPVRYENNSIGYFDKDKKIFRSFRMEDDTGINSFGGFYAALSNHIYFDKIKTFSHTYRNCEGKVMGLSAYGDFDTNKNKPYVKSTEIAKEFYDIDRYDFGLPHVDFYDFGKVVDNLIKNHYSPEDKSYFLQKNYEECLVYLIEELKKDYLDDNVCFAGGSFLNISANSLIRSMFDNIHIPPYPNDSGVHFGAAVWASYKSDETIQIPHNIAFLGKSYNDKDIEEAIGFKDLRNIGEIKYNKYKDFDELCEIVAKHLEDNKIVAWFQGRSEAGPRALGSRSILMNPSKKENKDIMNSRVKHREYWRPFAGITLEGRGYDSPYMLYSEQVLSDDVPAITHEDNTCRMQTVNDELNPRMCDLLRKLKNPILLNTSFNDNGEPIVESPEDAILAFKNMDIDYLVMGNYLISK